MGCAALVGMCCQDKVIETTTLAEINLQINRANAGDGRNMETYKIWFAETLSILAPMVVFVGQKSLVDFVTQHRTGHALTRVVLLPFEDLPLYNVIDIIRATQKSDKWLNCTKDRNRLENKLSEYIVLVNSKLQFLSWTAEANPFDSTYFFFLDAGISRWSAAITQAPGVRRPFPNMTKVQSFDPEGTLFLAQSGLPNPDNLKIPNINDWYTYCCVSGNGFNGGVIGGSGPTVTTMAKRHRMMLLHEVLPAQAVANEQMVLTILYNRNASIFKEIPYKCPDAGCAQGRVDGAISAIDWLA